MDAFLVLAPVDEWHDLTTTLAAGKTDCAPTTLLPASPSTPSPLLPPACRCRRHRLCRCAAMPHDARDSPDEGLELERIAVRAAEHLALMS